MNHSSFSTKKLSANQAVTVNGQTGEIFKAKSVNTKKIIKADKQAKIKKIPQFKPGFFKPDIKVTATKLYVNLGEPELAEVVALKNVDGVGLLRAEFMIAQIGVVSALSRAKIKLVDHPGLVENIEIPINRSQTYFW